MSSCDKNTECQIRLNLQLIDGSTEKPLSRTHMFSRFEPSSFGQIFDLSDERVARAGLHPSYLRIGTIKSDKRHHQHIWPHLTAERQSVC